MSGSDAPTTPPSPNPGAGEASGGATSGTSGVQPKAAMITSQRRDRIVILGRRGAGKSLYIAKLYDLLWRAPESFRMKAVQGTTHTACMEIVQELREGRWPQSTTGSRMLDFEVVFQRRKSAMTCLDYSGEVFRQAFVTNQPDAKTEELLAHIDRAAGVILLIDPRTRFGGDPLADADDSFGLLKAVERVRTSVGGARVPIAVVLTKHDKRRSLILQRVAEVKAQPGTTESANGTGDESSPVEPAILRRFFKKWFGPLAVELQEFECFAASVCEEEEVLVAGKGNQPERRVSRPKKKSRSYGIVEPLEYVMRKIGAKFQEQEIQQSRERAQVLGEQQAARDWKRDIRTLVITVAISLAVMGVIIWWVVLRLKAGS